MTKPPGRKKASARTGLAFSATFCVAIVMGASTATSAPPDEAPPTSDAEQAPPDGEVLETIPVQPLEESREGSTSSAGGATMLDPITVTATKSPESSRDVAAAIAALSAEQLEGIGASRIEDYAYFVPGMSWERQVGPGAQQLMLRGISAGSVGITVGVYVDDAPVGASSVYGNGNTSLDLAVFDLERLEVLRGPQGTLYGANTLGGLLKYVTRDPEPGVWSSTLAVDGSCTGEGDPNRAVRGVLNLPLGESSWAMRVGASQVREGGYIDSPKIQFENSDRHRKDNARAVLLGPLSNDVTLRLSIDWQDIAQGPVGDRPRLAHA